MTFTFCQNLVVAGMYMGAGIGAAWGVWVTDEHHWTLAYPAVLLGACAGGLVGVLVALHWLTALEILVVAFVFRNLGWIGRKLG